MRVEIAWRGCTEQGRNKLGAALKNAVKGFFKAYPGEPIETVSLVGLTVEPGGDGGKLIKLLPPRANHEKYVGDHVITGVFTYGSQQVCCAMQAPGFTTEELRAAIEAGPYLNRKKSKDTLGGEEVLGNGALSAESMDDQPEMMDTTASESGAPDADHVPDEAEVAVSELSAPEVTEMHAAEDPVPRFTKGWFSDTELVSLLLTSMLEHFPEEHIVLRDDFTSWIRSITNFVRPIDIGLLTRQLLVRKFISHGELSVTKQKYYRIERSAVQAQLGIVAADAESTERNRKTKLTRYWSEPTRLRKALLAICEGYPDGKTPSEIGLAKYAAGTEGERFNTELAGIIPPILVNMGFATPFFASDLAKVLYKLRYETIGAYLATGKLPAKVVEVPAAPVAEVEVKAAAEPQKPQDPLEQLRAQYDSLVLPLEDLERNIALRRESIKTLEDRRAALEAEYMALGEQLGSLKGESEVLDKALKEEERQHVELSSRLALGQRETLTKVIAALS